MWEGETDLPQACRAGRRQIQRWEEVQNTSLPNLEGFQTPEAAWGEAPCLSLPTPPSLTTPGLGSLMVEESLLCQPQPPLPPGDREQVLVLPPAFPSHFPPGLPPLASPPRSPVFVPWLIFFCLPLYVLFFLLWNSSYRRMPAPSLCFHIPWPPNQGQMWVLVLSPIHAQQS